MADERYILKPITNIDGKDSKRGYRLEIDEFLADNEVTNLFLIALAEMQENGLKLWNGKPDWLTYYSIAGIHGEPRENWNDYENTPERDHIFTYSRCGYSLCESGLDGIAELLTQLQSVVHAEMVRQASAFKDKDEKQSYLDAAARFRLPYWDIIMPRNDEQTEPPPGQTEADPTAIWGCPEILKAKSVYVKLPKGDPEKEKNGFWTIDNPLAAFKFPRAEEFQRSIDEGVQRKLLVIPQRFNQSQTARVPTSRSDKKTDNAAFDLVIQRQAVSSAISIWQMLNPDQIEKASTNSDVEIIINEERSWESFANDTVPAYETQGYSFATVSCESFHDDIHSLIGTGGDDQESLPKKLRSKSEGHMGSPSFAAFDPIFWLHHNNIERLLCFHQAMHPDKYTSAKDSKKVLYPFMKGTGEGGLDCYTSEDALIKQYWGSGYATPGNSQLSKRDAYKLIKKYLTDNYYWATNAKRVSRSLQGWPKKDYIEASWALRGAEAKSKANAVVQLKAISVVEGVPRLVAQEISLKEPASPKKDKIITTSSILDEVRAVHSSFPIGILPEPVSTQDGSPTEQITWNAHVRVRKFAFNGSFSVHLFVGHVKDDQPERYMTKKNEAGFAGIFATPEGSGCASCDQNREDDILVENVVPLTAILYDYLDASPNSETLIRNAHIKTIPNLKPEYVVPFLTENLQWRMIDLGCNLLSGQEQQAKLEVTVTSRQFLPPTRDNLMGVYGPYSHHAQTTSTKPGGAGYVY